MTTKREEQYKRCYKTFPDFYSGLRELASSCQVVKQSVSGALENVPTSGIMVSAADLMSVQEPLVILALILQASRTPCLNKYRWVYAKSNRDGFLYRTTSGFVFGWRKMGKKNDYRFFVVLGPESKYPWVESQTVKLLELGWLERGMQALR